MLHARSLALQKSHLLLLRRIEAAQPKSATAVCDRASVFTETETAPTSLNLKLTQPCSWLRQHVSNDMVVPYVGLEQLLRQGEGVLGQDDGERQQHRLAGGGAAGASARIEPMHSCR